jgi:hydroxymethylbilane synthase
MSSISRGRSAMGYERESVRIGTRGSALALWQAKWLWGRLALSSPGLVCSIVTFTTTGDRILDKPLPEIGGKGLFTEELERALLDGSIDLAVHSLKDLPVDNPPGLVLGAIAEREDPRDALVSARWRTVDELPRRARVGTSSLRRSAQLLALRPDLELLPLRGNVDTRVKKALEGDYDAIVLAAAGLLRLGRGDAISMYFDFADMLPAPGQGALAVQCRSDDETTLGYLAGIDHGATRTAVLAERSFLKALGGGCSAPIAALAAVDARGLSLDGLVAARDGSRLLRSSARGTDPEELGRRLAEEAFARGARELLS